MSAASTQSSERPRVVILGAGFAGLNAAKMFKDKPVDVVLVDRTNHHKFQPLLYQVATAGLEPGEIAHTTREIFRNVPNISFRLGTVKSVDAHANQLLLRSGEPLDYDYLILAAGAVTNYFGIEGVKEHSFPLKNVPDAIDLRSHILRLFERVDREREGAPQGALNFVIVGGGPTGIEMAGALVELFKVMRRDYRHVNTLDARVFLVEMLPDLLPLYSERSQKYTRRVLEKRGVEVLTERTVACVTKGAVHLKSGETTPT